jgi:low affinity Fe/Cu permease
MHQKNGPHRNWFDWDAPGRAAAGPSDRIVRLGGYNSGNTSVDQQELGMERVFTTLSTKIAYWTGTPASFVICIAIVAIWAATGPIFRFSDTWQLVINTGTTIVTFLMVFLIQNTQNRDGAALQTKLDELIRVSDAKNLFVGIEHLTESEVEEIRRKCEEAAKREKASS